MLRSTSIVLARPRTCPFQRSNYGRAGAPEVAWAEWAEKAANALRESGVFYRLGDALVFRPEPDDWVVCRGPSGKFARAFEALVGFALPVRGRELVWLFLHRSGFLPDLATQSAGPPAPAV